MVGLFMELRPFVMGTFVMGSFGVEIVRLWVPVVFFTSNLSCKTIAMFFCLRERAVRGQNDLRARVV